jgi:argininosuccinate lyase
MSKKLWGAMFDKPTHEEVEIFASSLAEDARLWEVDIECSMAHARMLGETGIIPKSEAAQIISGLGRVRERLTSGELIFSPTAEDVHSEIERFLKEEIGPIAGKLHTGRSRNDQVATDIRLYLSRQMGALNSEIARLQEWLVTAAEKFTHVAMPGLTHMQHAQPVSLAHHLLAYFWMLERDRARFSETIERTLVLPLGSAALAGTPHPLDREAVAKELGFRSISENSLDAVSDRDFAIEALAAGSILAMHLSRMAEEIVLWQTPEFGFIRLDDSVTTGSSIMPQKKNPDVAELIRGRTGRSYGALAGLLVMMKGLPLAYNRDMQEDKEHLFTGIDNSLACTRLLRICLEGAEFRTERMAAALNGDFSNATDLADCLVEKGVPFREAHSIVGQIVNFCLNHSRTLESLSALELKNFNNAFDDTTPARLKHLATMEARQTPGGTASRAVQSQLLKARAKLEH